ncbi:oligosaccharide flippase family protein [Capnocytophaga canimorsus]|uniref:oligosaccharide flippase family protein n=1 Tax=Capnocytophaga canimorsus TaxID=28188 RepID=UPI001AD46C91|nr:oligosaccharide flippase family protein [Capnocytophaga canimorsus]GIM59043.1 transporter [Capnocytophaga canimorsus]
MKDKVDNIKRFLNENFILLSNFSYLSFLHIVTLLMPLLTYPYLIRVLGKDLYGLVVFTQVIAGYFTIFISFGFSMFGAKEVSIHRDNKKKLSEILINISFIKSIFLLISFIVLLMYLLYTSSEHKSLYALAFWVCLLDVIFPAWFFQGIEKMKFITFTSLFARGIFVLFIFVLVKNQADILWLPISNMIGTIVSGIISFYLIKKEGIKFVLPNLSIIKGYIERSYHFFLSNVLIQIYANSNKAIIGVFLGMGAVAYYDLAEKIVSLIRIPQGILSQTVFPRISMTKNTIFIKKIFNISIWLNVGLYIVLFFTANNAVLLLGGEEMLQAVSIVRILGLLAPIVAISNVMGILTLIPFGFNKLFTKMIGISVISYLLIFVTLWMLNIVSVHSLSIANVLVEVIVSIISVYFVYKSNLIWKKNMIT